MGVALLAVYVGFNLLGYFSFGTYGAPLTLAGGLFALLLAPEFFQPLRDFASPAIDLLGPLPYTALQTMFDATAPRGLLSYWKSEYLRVLDGRAIHRPAPVGAQDGQEMAAVDAATGGWGSGRCP